MFTLGREPVRDCSGLTRRAFLRVGSLSIFGLSLSGVGIKMGTVVGQTDKNCERPVGPVHSTHDFAATIYRLLGIDCTKEYMTPDGRPVLINYHGVPIADALA